MQKKVLAKVRLKKLVLNRETLSSISDGNLEWVAGGISAVSSCDVNDGKAECLPDPS